MVEENLSLVKSVVLGLINPNESVQGLGYDDLYQTGCEALCHAALSYQEGRGASFRTFASIVIRNRLLSHCRKINRVQSPLEYLEAPVPDAVGLTYADVLEDTRQPLAAKDRETLNFLAETAKEYHGVARKGIDVLRLKCMGHNMIDIAAYYGLKPNYISACLSRSTEKMRNDRRFIRLLQS